MGSIMVPLYLFRNSFLTMIYAPTNELSSISLEASTPFLIQRKFDKLIILSIFTKFLRLNITKIWEATDKFKFNMPKKPLKAQKLMVSDNVLEFNSYKLSLKKESSSHKLGLEKEPNLYRLNLGKSSNPVGSTLGIA